MNAIAALTRAAVAGKSAVATGWSAVWTFPTVLLSAFLVAWGAEAAQFLISQGLALAILAWLQTLPEFAVEAVIAWRAARDPLECELGAAIPAGTACYKPLAIANFTGAIRLLIGLGWPMIYFVFAWSRRGGGRRLPEVALDDEHAIEVMGLLLPVLYFFVVWWKASLSLLDGALLTTMYVVYLFLLWRVPPRERTDESLEDVGAVPRAVLQWQGVRRITAIIGLFAGGGLLLYFVAHPFVESLRALAFTIGVSEFFFVQWVAPFLSEFPEKTSAFYWARKVRGAPMALMNMVSSNINQWTVLAAMIPLVYAFGLWNAGAEIGPLRFDPEQRLEILLTVLQSTLAFLLLCNMRFRWWEAALLFLLWFVQFLRPGIHEWVAGAYAVWAGLVVVAYWRSGEMRAPVLFWRIVRRGRVARPVGGSGPNRAGSG